MNRQILILCFLALLGGCSSTSKQKSEPALTNFEQKILDENRRTSEILSKTSLLVAKSLAVYVRTNQAKVQPTLTQDSIRQAITQNTYIPAGFEKKISFAWNFAPEPYLKSLASTAGYTLVYTNQRPPISKSITVDSQTRNIKQFIDIVSQQTVGYIKDILVVEKDNRKEILVVYENF